jgi:SNF2 family DNA or RNA helicase
MTRLQQICSGYLPADDEDDLRPIGKEQPRLKRLLEILETVPRQAIIWAKYNIDVDEIARALGKAGHTFDIYDGRTPSDDRQRVKQDFQAGRFRFFLGKPTAAGRGLTLTAADTVIYYNNGWSLDDRLQSEDRAHRIGQKRTVNYIDIVGRGTIDEYILKILKEKRQLSAQVMGDEILPWI